MPPLPSGLRAACCSCPNAHQQCCLAKGFGWSGRDSAWRATKAAVRLEHFARMRGSLAGAPAPLAGRIVQTALLSGLA